MARVKFLVNTSHPDYGEIKEGEVLAVTRDYADHYIQLGFAEDSSEDLSRESYDPGLT